MTTGRRHLPQDRVLVAAIAGLTAISWWYMVATGKSCHGHATLGAAFVMWAGMMVGMMLPSAAPMLLTHAAVARRRASQEGPAVSTGYFLSGYLLAWTGYSALAAVLQKALSSAALLDDHSQAVGPWLGAGLLIAGGIFQLTPAKQACLDQCRAPLGFFMTEWRQGRWGAVRMGLQHGLFCIGCCWILMALLFVAGVMNLLWGVAVTLYVSAEKLLPWRRVTVWAGAIACFVGGLGIVAHALLRP